MLGEANPHSVLSHVNRAEKIVVGMLVLIFMVGVGFDLSDQPLYEGYRAVALGTWTIVLLGFTLPSAFRCASYGYRSVWSVIAYSVVQLGVFLVVFYTCYYWVGASAGPGGSDKILTFPPMIAALWAAGVGWYLHFQATAKNHRTTNAFNLIMQTRTSKEFLDRALKVQLTFPYGQAADVADEELIKPSALKILTAHEREQTADGKAADPELLERLEKARGADAMRYLLNYYEFMAVGIKAKDLDEDLLYETLSVTVTSMYARGKVFIDYLRHPEKGNQRLAFDELEALVARWNERLRAEIAKLSH
jgi:hypothetical protein